MVLLQILIALIPAYENNTNKYKAFMAQATLQSNKKPHINLVKDNEAQKH